VRESRQHTPISPKLSTTLQKITQRRQAREIDSLMKSANNPGSSQKSFVDKDFMEEKQ
tara:strand:+ start:4853 stop:5026 length:174 start_codon:yes stop_codon:yes gene_type:complete